MKHNREPERWETLMAALLGGAIIIGWLYTFIITAGG